MSSPPKPLFQLTYPWAGLKQPKFSEGSAAAAKEDYDLLEGVQDKAVSNPLRHSRRKFDFTIDTPPRLQITTSRPKLCPQRLDVTLRPTFAHRLACELEGPDSPNSSQGSPVQTCISLPKDEH